MTEILMGQILFLCCTLLVGLVIGRLTGIDDALSCLLAGVIAGQSLPLLGIDSGIRADNLQHIVFYVVLPVLIFEAAWHLQPRLLTRWIGPILLLSVVGVLVSTGVMALLLYIGIGHSSGFPWSSALLAGAILAATDPVAVVSALKRYSAPSDLTTLIEGESLFNDATSVVLFMTLLGIVSGSSGADQNYLLLFLQVFFGGIAVGIILGGIGAGLVLFIGKVSSRNIILVLLAFLSFYSAESLFHVSGIMAIVASSITARTILRNKPQAFLKGISTPWEWLGALLNGIIFVLMGLTITFQMFSSQWLAMLIAIVAALIARAAAVFFCGALSLPMPHSVPMRWQYIQFWGGLRGAIAIALVLALPTSVTGWWTIQSMVYAVVLFTLLVQGPGCGSLIKKYGHN